MIRELLAVDVRYIHRGVEDFQLECLLVALSDFFGIITGRYLLLYDCNDSVYDELLACIRTENICEICEDNFSVCRIEIFIIDGRIAYGDGDEHSAHGCENVEVTYVFEETCARRC